MAYNQGLADDLRARLEGRPGLSERKMFGGIGFMINENMAVGVSGDDLMIRVSKDAHDEALSQVGARAFDMSGRAKGWILLSPDGLSTDQDLGRWVDQSVAHAESLPPK
jgi:TfoX/Sxy family transcriptional regulator of competence genes